ncbi:hypothetical protein [uncultured Maribacter sp.]|uniref:hypothetical protein n=1 Tax=uncultured Maribacter sp. TaxID=431308 RepID=UPI0026352AB7|nr:hypothetical protein [uncultured Maribacter sp.]
MNSKAIYFILGIISVLILTPCLIWPLTSNVSTFEGGRAYSRFFATPILFIGFLILWFIDYKIFYKPTNMFLKYRIIVFSIIIIVSSIGLKNFISNELNVEKAGKQNTYGCKADVKDSYEGYITDTQYQRLKIRKNDSNLTEFKYSRLKLDNFDSYFYEGQKISKKANETEFEVELRDGSLRRFKIPCYQ